MATLYQVVFSGQLKPGISPDQAAADLSSLFKLPAEEAEALVRAERPQVLKRDVAEINVEHYRSLFDEIGLVVSIESMAETASEDIDQNGPASEMQEGSPVAASVQQADTEITRARDRDSRSDLEPGSPAQGAGSAGRESRDGVSLGVFGEVCARIRARQPARLPAGRGWTWILQGLALFKTNFLSWLAMVLVMILITGVISLVPVLGSLAALVLLQVFAGGLMLAAQEQMQNGAPRLGSLFAGFRQQTGSLFALGSLYLTAVFMMLVLVGILTAAFGYSTLNALDPDAFQQADPVMMMQMLGPVLPLMLVFFLALMLPLQMAFWFAPALVVLGRLPPTAALQLSLQASWRNVLGFLLFGFTLGIALNLAMLLPFGLGLIGSVLVVALMITSTYCAFREIFCSD